MGRPGSTRRSTRLAWGEAGLLEQPHHHAAHATSPTHDDRVPIVRKLVKMPRQDSQRDHVIADDVTGRIVVRLTDVESDRLALVQVSG
jgi:hypothetical protein